MNTVGAAVRAEAPPGRCRLLFPEFWPPAVRAGGVIAVALGLFFGAVPSLPFLGGDVAAIRDAMQSVGPGWPGPRLFWQAKHTVLGYDARIFHASGLLLHGVAGLLLFMLLRQMQTAGEAAARSAFLVTVGGALIWMLHPRQTEAVAGLAYQGSLLGAIGLLLTLLCFARGAERGRPSWMGGAMGACILGMATDPVMLAAPLLVLLYDRAFIAGSWTATWRQRGRWHAALGVTMVVGIYFLARSGGTPVGSLSAPFWAAPWYLMLSVWPAPLVFDRGPDFAPGGGFAAGVMTILLLVGTIVAVIRWPRAGFVAVWFWATLAAGSLVNIAGVESFSEHRLYLPWAALVMALVAGATRLRRVGLAGLAVAVLGLGWASRERISVYASSLALWTDTVTKAPGNPRAHLELGHAFAAAGRLDEAVAAYEHAIQFSSSTASTHLGLAGAALQLGRTGEALSAYEAALRLTPESAAIHLDLAAVQIRLGRVAEATGHYREAARLGVSTAVGKRHYGRALAESGRMVEALAELEASAKLEPANARTHLDLGMVLSALGRSIEGQRHFVEAVQCDPDDAGAHFALGDALLEDHRPAEALSHYEAALRLQPERAAALHASMGDALSRLGRPAEAIRNYETALRLNPDNERARENLARIRAAAERHGGRKK